VLETATAQFLQAMLVWEVLPENRLANSQHRTEQTKKKKKKDSKRAASPLYERSTKVPEDTE
jgi:hypothetical protein